MVQVVKVWTDEVLMKMAGWKEIPVDTTIGRIMKLATQGDIVELTGVNHRFRGQVWKRAVRSGHRLRSALSDMWVDVDSTVDGVYGNQEGAEVGYNPKKKGQKAYQYVMAFVGETKEVLHSWFRGGSAYTSNGVVVLNCINKRYMLSSWAKGGRYAQESTAFNVYGRGQRNIKQVDKKQDD